MSATGHDLPPAMAPLFRDFAPRRAVEAWRRLLVAGCGALLVLLFALTSLGLLAAGAPEEEERPEVPVTFYRTPPVPVARPVPQVLDPPPPPPPPANRKLRPVRRSVAPPPPLVAPSQVPDATPDETDPGEEAGPPEAAPPEEADPAGLPGGQGEAGQAAVTVTAPPPPPPPPPPPAVELPPGATPPKRLNPEVIPVYPRLAERAGIEGDVVIRVIVHVDGRVQFVEFRRCNPEFDSAVLAVVDLLRYRPAQHEGRAIAVYRDLRFPFSLR